MGRGWRPILVGAPSSSGTFAPCEGADVRAVAPRRRRTSPVGDVYRGETVFQRELLRLSRRPRKGGGVGPSACGTRTSTRRMVTAAVQQGRGVMPAGLVSGQERGGRRRLRRLHLEPYGVVSAAWRSRPGSCACSSPRRSSSRARRRTTPTSSTSRCTHEGVTGHGEAAPDRALRRVGAVGASRSSTSTRALVGDDPFALEDDRRAARPIAGEQAAKSALDAALHDLQGKLLGRPGVSAARAAASRAADVVDDLARRSRRHGAPRREGGARRYRRLKLKLGGGDGLDVERVRAVRGVDRPAAAWSTSTSAWSLDEALDALPQLAEIGVEYCEQPLRAGDEGGRELKRALAGPDLRRRGLPHARRRRRAAPRSRTASTSSSRSRAASARRSGWRTRRGRCGMGVMLGCMVESGLGIAAGCCVAPLCDHVDLDGNLLLARGPVAGRRARRRRAGAVAQAGARRYRPCVTSSSPGSPGATACPRVFEVGRGVPGGSLSLSST